LLHGHGPFELLRLSACILSHVIIVIKIDLGAGEVKGISPHAVQHGRGHVVEVDDIFVSSVVP
jgi:hypothetical protein